MLERSWKTSLQSEKKLRRASFCPTLAVCTAARVSSQLCCCCLPWMNCREGGGGGEGGLKYELYTHIHTRHLTHSHTCSLHCPCACTYIYTHTHKHGMVQSCNHNPPPSPRTCSVLRQERMSLSDFSQSAMSVDMAALSPSLRQTCWSRVARRAVTVEGKWSTMACCLSCRRLGAYLGGGVVRVEHSIYRYEVSSV